LLLKSIYVRFYKSFNYDYLRKSHQDAKPNPWDLIESGRFFPFVRVPVERDITTVVGANESGKSQLLSAVKCGISGMGIERGDFCRYSHFFTVDRAMNLPEFGIEFSDLSDVDLRVVRTACGLDDSVEFEYFAVFRRNECKLSLFIPGKAGGAWEEYAMPKPAAIKALTLPTFFEIDANIPLPDSVSLESLASGSSNNSRSRAEWRRRLGAIRGNPNWFRSTETVTKSAQAIFQAMADETESDGELAKKVQLADDLLVKVAGIDRSAFQELQRAVTENADGYANGIVHQINTELAKSLNFHKWWSQDSDFRLSVTLRDYDLVFTVKDRTGTEYSFNERSGGLKYFMSYFVQYLAHETPQDGRREVLLMDEPDAYLSTMGQQDLLRIFDAFAHPQEPDRTPCQVIYVTHSPFLIDKNHGERIRVLEKGEGDEGTRVVRNAARNHYEPLRSAFGGFVGETTFISNCNLMLEGMSDQVLLAGVSGYLRGIQGPGIQNLDLNSITLVPAGSASQIPYLTYLARGRDADRPAVIVLLDSDKAGDDAKKVLARGATNKRILDPKHILQIGDLIQESVVCENPQGLKQIEDLVPTAVAVQAAYHYVEEYVGRGTANAIMDINTKRIFSDGFEDTHSAVEAAVCTALSDELFHLDKVGFARSVVRVLHESDASVAAAKDALLTNFKALFTELGRLQRAANREITAERTKSRINRVKSAFMQDHPSHAKREDAAILLEEIEAQIGTSSDVESTRTEIRRLRSEFKLDEDLAALVEGYDNFLAALTTLAYLEIQESQDLAVR